MTVLVCGADRQGDADAGDDNPEKPIVPTFLIHHFYSLRLGKEKNSSHSQR